MKNGAIGRSLCEKLCSSCCLLIVLASAGQAANLPISVTTSTGTQLKGDWVAVTETGIELDQAGRRVSVAGTDLMSLESTAAEKRSTPPVRVLLVGGSQLAVDGVRTEGEQIVIEARRQPSLRLPLKQVKAIRFRRPSAATDPVWLGMIDKQSRGDRMVIHRSNDRLDPTEGIVSGIADGKVQFVLDGDPIAAPVDRLEGVILGGTDQASQSPDILVTDVYGSTWAGTALLPTRLDQASADRGIQVQLTGDVTHLIPVDLVRSVRWSSGLSMLADTDPAKEDVQPEFAITWKNDAVQKWFGPQADGQDLILYGGTKVEYRVEKGFRLLSGSVRRSDEIVNASGVTVRIKADDQVVWENDLPNADSLGFELELGKARRIKIEIDSGDDGDGGAIVRMVRPRFVK